MAKAAKLECEEADNEFYSKNAKWSVSSIVSPTPPPAAKAEESPPATKPSEDGPKSRGTAPRDRRRRT